MSSDEPRDTIASIRGVGGDSSLPCDMCEGSFLVDVLNPVSGDWWLCNACLRKYMGIGEGLPE